MSKRNIFIAGFLFVLMQIGMPTAGAQNQNGFFRVIMKAKSFQGTPGMQQWYPWTGFGNPSLQFHINPIKVKDGSGAMIGEHVLNKVWSYPGRPSGELHTENFQLIDDIKYYNSSSPYINLSNSSSFKANFTKISANGGSSGFHGFYLSPFSWSISYFTPIGNNFHDRVISISGTTTNGTVIQYPYYFTIETAYDVDAIESALKIKNSSGAVTTEFCEGQRITIEATYKRPFYNGTFEFQKSYNNGATWTTLSTPAGRNYTYDYAANPGVTVRYRARLKASSSTYGVGHYNSTLKAEYNGPLTVHPQIDDIYYSVKKVCEGATNGTVRITGLPGALEGSSYKIQLQPGNVSQTIVYTNNYLTDNEVLLEAPAGNYSITVTRLSNALLCALTKPNVYIGNSITPVHTFEATDAVCGGGNGQIKFRNAGSGYSQKTFRVSSVTTGNTLTITSTIPPTFQVLAGAYVMSVENFDGCIYNLSDTAFISEPQMLEASITPDELIEINGISYHGCQGDLTTIELNITGGVPPYRVRRQIGSNGWTYNLLPNQSSIRFPSLQPITYTFYVSDSKGCAITPINYTMTQIPPPGFPALETHKTEFDCGTSLSNGSIIQLEEVDGDMPPYELYFNEELVTSFDSMNLPNVNVHLRIIDSIGCLYKQQVNLVDNSFFRLQNDFELPDSPVPCGGTHNINMIVEGGDVTSTGGYTFFHNGVNCDNDPNCNLTWFEAGYPIAYYTIAVDTGGVHYFEVVDESGCLVSSAEEIPTREATPKVETIAVVPPNCMNGIYEVTFYLNALNPELFGGGPTINYVLDGVSGSIEPAKQGGIPIIPYEFTLPVSGDSLHQISVTDGINCGSPIPFQFTLTPLDPIALSIDLVTESRCSYDTSGIIGFSMTGDIPFQVELFRDGNRIDSLEVVFDEYSFNELLPGNYQIAIVDAKGCSASENNIMLTMPDSLMADVASSSFINCTGNNGAIEVTNVSGGLAPYQFSLNGQVFQSNTLLENAFLQNEITVRDSNNCILTLSLGIPEAGPTLFPVINQLLAVSECSLGKALLELQAGFTYPIYIAEIENPSSYFSPDAVVTTDSISTVLFRDTLENMTFGKHYYFIKDGLGCETIDSIEMTASAPLMATVATKTPEVCYQTSSDGSITLNMTGGLAPYTVLLLGDTSFITNDSISFTGLTHGKYAFNIKDSNGCFYDLNDSIVSGNLPMLTDSTANFLGCRGIDLIGVVTLTGHNGTAPYSFEWEDGNMDNPRAGVAPGQYLATVTDVNGCTNVDVIDVFAITDSLVLNSGGIIDVACQADSTGQISVTATGGFTPYTFSIDGGNNFQIDSTFTGLPIGTFTILAQDDHGCTDTTSATITFTDALNASVATTNQSCNANNDGILTVTILGGIAPFTYSLDDVNYQFQNIFNGLSSGTYTAYVKDGSGCQAIYTNNVITEPSVLSLFTNIIAQETCTAMNGKINGTVTGGTPPYTYEWNGNPSLNADSLADISAGTYTLLVTDANMCTESSVVVLNDSPGPLLNLESSQDEFCGMSNGQINLSVSNGTTPFSFQWSHNGALNDSLASNLTAGSYTVTITDANMCTAVLTTTLTEVAGPSLASLLENNSICTNDNGSVSVSLSNGIAPFTYTWSHNGTLNNNIATNLSAGFYTVTVTDGNGCTHAFSTSIAFDAPPVFTAPMITDVSCSQSNGVISVSTNGGTSPLSYTWSHNAGLNASTANGLTDGAYSVTVTDGLGCTEVLANMLVNSLPEPILSVTSFNNTDCLFPQGDITVQTTGGQPPFTYGWSHDGALTGATASGLNSGDYTITVTDGNGCTAMVTQSLLEFQGDMTITNEPICSYGSDGSLIVNLQGSPTDYTYQWSDSNIPNTHISNNLSAGIYTVTVTNTNGCTETFTEEITAPTALSIPIPTTIPVGCNGNLGSATATATGGTGTLSYQWNDGNDQTTATANNLITGNYEVLVTDANGCTLSEIVTIGQATEMILTPGQTISPLCNGDENGSIEIIVSQGEAPYTYSWNSNQTTATATNLPAGLYIVTVTDAVGCTKTQAVTLDEPILLSGTALSSQSPLCAGGDEGTTSVTATGGTSPYQYEWNDALGQTTATATSLGAGSYDVIITDNNGCTTISSAEVTEPMALEIVNPILSAPSCVGGTDGGIAISVVGGTPNYQYNWIGLASNNNTITNLTEGTYTIEATDDNGCSLSTSITLDDPDPTTVTNDLVALESSQDEICGNANGSIDLQIGNGVAPYSIDWAHDNTLSDSLAIDLAQGLYTVTVTGANQCSDTLIVNVGETPGPTLTLVSNTNSLCTDDNGTIVLETTSGTGSFQYNWSHDLTLNNNTATNLPSGTYEVTVSDDNACTAVVFTTIIFDAPPVLNTPTFTNSTCNGSSGSIETSLSGGTAPFSYSWTHDANLTINEATTIPGGNYGVTVTDALGCTSTWNDIVVEELAAPVISVTAFNNTDCLNPQGGITVATTGGEPPLSYEWSHDSAFTGTVATDLNSGNYTITVTDVNGCESTVEQALIEFEGTIQITNSLDCSYDSDGSLLLTLQGDPSDYDYQWSDTNIPNTHTPTGLSSDSYTVTVTNSNGCTQDFTINLDAPDPLVPNVSVASPVGCNGNLGTAIASPSGGTGAFTYQWNDPGNQTTGVANALSVGTYELLLTDANGCTAVESVELTQATEMILSQGQSVSPACNGDQNGEVQIIVNQGEAPYTYLWNNNETTSSISNLFSGEYIVTVADAVDCTVSMSISLDEPEVINTEMLLIQEPLCNGGDEGSAMVNVTGGTAPFQYEWNDTQLQTTATATTLIAGQYLVNITDANGCTELADLSISEPTALQISDIIVQQPACVDGTDGTVEVTVEGGTPNYQYSWDGSAASDNNILTSVVAGSYIIAITDGNGCTLSENYEVNNPDPILLVEETVSAVSCLGTPNGVIEILAAGGNQNLSYSWSNGMSGTQLTDLSTGIYEVSIEDGLGCITTQFFLVGSIDTEPIDLGNADTTICNRDVIFYDFSGTGYTGFSWGTLSEGELSTAPSFTTSEEGAYYLHALRDDGCLVKDTIEIRYAAVSLDAFFIAPTDIVAGDTIVALELTLPVPDSVIWDYDSDNVEFVEQINNQYLFHFPTTGDYDLSLTSFIGNCNNDITKEIFVYADSTELPFVNANVPIIVDFKLFPNPNSGSFSIDVTLSAVNDLAIDIFNDETTLIDRALFSGEDKYSKDYELDLPGGVYYVLIQVAGARRSLTFVVE